MTKTTSVTHTLHVGQATASLALLAEAARGNQLDHLPTGWPISAPSTS